jgi:hypothetical protein
MFMQYYLQAKKWSGARVTLNKYLSFSRNIQQIIHEHSGAYTSCIKVGVYVHKYI